mgnify:CR=1 FL=1
MEALVIHRGFGNKKQVFVSGHVFEQYSETVVDKKISLFKTIRNNLKRYINKPAKQVEVVLEMNGLEQKATTNHKGFFQIAMDISHEAIGWYHFKVRVPTLELTETAEYKICDDESTGVISDIDDTLLVSHSGIDLRKLYTYLSKGTNKRKPTAALNHILKHLSTYNNGVGTSDYFYVSNSEWNLYEFLLAFFDLNEIPKGVYLLNSIIHHPFDFFRKQGKSEVEGHKLKSFFQLLSVFPNKSFVLIGDTAQHDVQLFQRVLDKKAHQIKAILLREVREKHLKKYAELEEKCAEKNITFEIFE